MRPPSIQPLLRVLLAVALVFAASSAASDERDPDSPRDDDTAFVELGFDQARKRANKERKLVMIALGAAGCQECRRLEETWRDPEVVAWLNEQVVAIRADRDAQSELRKRYGVSDVPAQIFVDPQGGLDGLLLGYRTPEAFLADADTALFSQDSGPLARARTRRIAAPDDPTARLTYARALRRTRKHEEAMAEYLWLFDYFGSLVRGGTDRGEALAQLGVLARLSPKVRAELEKRRDAIEAAALAGKPLPGGPLTGDGLRDLVDLDSDTGLGQVERTLALYDRLVAAGAEREATRRALAALIREPLRVAGRYRDLVRDLDPAATFAAEADGFEHAAKLAAALPPAVRARGAEGQSDRLAMLGADAWELLAGAGETAAANGILDRLLALDASRETFAELAARAARLEVETARDAERELEKRARATLPEADVKALFDTAG